MIEIEISEGKKYVTTNDPRIGSWFIEEDVFFWPEENYEITIPIETFRKKCVWDGYGIACIVNSYDWDYIEGEKQNILEPHELQCSPLITLVPRELRKEILNE